MSHSPSLRSFMDGLVLLEQELLTAFPALSIHRWRDEPMRWPALWHELRTSPARPEVCKQHDLMRIASVIAVDGSSDLLAANEQLEEYVDAARELYDNALNPDVSDPLGAHSAKRLKLERTYAVNVPADVVGVVFVFEIELVRIFTP